MSKQYTIKGVLKNGKVVRARSRTIGDRPSIATVEQARDEAWENFYRALASNLGLGSDEDEGMRAIRDKKRVLSVSEGWVYYKNV